MNHESNLHSEHERTSSAAAWLASLPNLLQTLDRRAGGAAETLRVQRELIQAMGPVVSSIDGQVRIVHRELGSLLESHAALDLVLQHNARLTDEHFESRVLEPLIRRLFPIVDLIDSIRPDARPGNGCPQCLDAVLDQVLELLAVYGVEPVAVPAGDRFVARSMRAGGTLPAPSRSATGTVASTLRRGFSKGERVLRPPVVAVYGEPQHTDNNKENHDDPHDRP